MRMCKICGRSFLPKNEMQVYCSEACRNIAKNIEEDRKEMREWREARKAKKKKPTFTMSQVIAAMKKYDCQYEQAVAILESAKSKKRKVEKK